MNDDMQGALPPGWVWTTLGEIADTTRRRTLPSNKPSLPFIGMEHIEAQTMKLLKTVPASEMRSSAEYFTPGDVLYGRLRPYLNKVYAPDFEGLCSGEFIVFRKTSRLEPKYLQYFLNQQSFASFATHLNAGDRPRVSFDQLAPYQFPLAPLNEQHRIVAKIEELLTRLDAGVAALKRAQANLKRYKASVLKAACEGKLVPTEAELARAEGRTYEPADVLLQRILSERRAKWEADLRAKGKDPSKVKYVAPQPPDTSGLPELPEGWCWVRAEQICDFITKGTTPSATKMINGGMGEIPYIKVYNLTYGGMLDFTINPTFIARKTHLTELNRSRVYPGDVLMNIVGPPLGKVSIVPDIYPEWNINQAVAIFRTITGYDRGFLSMCLQNEDILVWAKHRAKATAGQFNLTLEICRDLPVPLAPIAEQRRIVSEVERRLSVISKVDMTINTNLARAERLRQSILRRAFSGKLVPQDPNDEPAGALLERIHAASVPQQLTFAGEPASPRRVPKTKPSA